MKTMIGEEGTEQFTVTTRVNDRLIREQKIHDPFIHTTVKLRGWGHAWRALFGGIKVHVSVDGTPGVNRAIMMLDPTVMKEDTEQFLREMAASRERNVNMGTVGYSTS